MQSIEMTHPAIVKLPDFLFVLPQSLGNYELNFYTRKQLVVMEVG